MKVCIKCKVSEATRHSWCVPCEKAYNREYRAKNRAKLLEESRKYHAANREKIKAGQRDHYRRNTDKVKAKSLEYYAKNREVGKLKRRAYHAKNAIAGRKRSAAWKAKNPERAKELSRVACLNRHVRSRAAEGRHTAEDIKTLYEKQNGLCIVCRTSLSEGYEVDHMNPLSRGGSNWPDNLQLLCAPCNQRKGAKTMQEFVGV